MEVLYGLHPVEEAIRSGARQLDHVSIARERRDGARRLLVEPVAVVLLTGVLDYVGGRGAAGGGADLCGEAYDQDGAGYCSGDSVQGRCELAGAWGG